MAAVHEALIDYGPDRITDVDLLAILLQPGLRGHDAKDLAQRVLRQCAARAKASDQETTALTFLLHCDSHRLSEIAPELSQPRIAQVMAAIQLGIRATKVACRRRDVGNPTAVYEFIAPQMRYLTTERFVVIPVNAKNNILDVCIVSEGTLTASLVHAREIFKPAIRRSAHAVILAHNHPSGDPTPSREDKEVTQRLIGAGKLLGIEVLDHIVVGDGRYTSFRERGLADFS